MNNLIQQGFQKISYNEAKEQLKVNYLFSIKQDKKFIKSKNIYIYQGDFESNENFFDTNYDLLIIIGNCIIHGELVEAYYVTGNLQLDAQEIIVDVPQFIGGELIVKFYQSAYLEEGSEHGITKIAKTKITAPVFQSYYIDLNSFEFHPDTVIFNFAPSDEMAYPHIQNHIFYGSASLYFLVPDFGIVSTDSDDYFFEMQEVVCEKLKNKETIFIEGFSVEALASYNEGLSWFALKEMETALYCFQKTIALFPKFTQAYLYAAKCLANQPVSACKQAHYYYEKLLALNHFVFENGKMSLTKETALNLLRIKEYDKALALMKTLELDSFLDMEYDIYFRHNTLYAICFRVLGEIYLYKNDLETAFKWLKKSINLDSFFTNHWLLGLVHFKQNDSIVYSEFEFLKAKMYHDEALHYTETDSLNFFYGEPRHCEWASQPSAPVAIQDRNQAYYDSFLQGKTNLKPFDATFMKEIFEHIPEEYRTEAMAHSYLDNTNETDHFFSYFRAVINKELVLKALHYGATNLRNIPASLIDKDIIEALNIVDLEIIDPKYHDYKLYLKAIQHNAIFQWKHIPKEMRTEELYVMSVFGGTFSEEEIPVSIPYEYHHNFSLLKKAVQHDFRVLNELHPSFVTPELFDLTLSLYENNPLFNDLLSEYAPKRFNDLPLKKIWSCFHVDELVLKRLAEGDDPSPIPSDRFSANYAELVMQNSPYHFRNIPFDFRSYEICKQAVKYEENYYKYVPVTHRKPELLEGLYSGDYLLFVPIAQRTYDLCLRALNHHKQYECFIPYEYYVALYTQLLTDEETKFYNGECYVRRGIGYFYEKKYDLAEADFYKVTEADDTTYYNEDTYLLAHYFLGWIAHLGGDDDIATEYYDIAIYKKTWVEAERKSYTEWYSYYWNFLPYSVAEFPAIVEHNNDLDYSRWEVNTNYIKAYIDEEQDYASSLLLLEINRKALEDNAVSNPHLWVVYYRDLLAVYEATGMKTEAEALCFLIIEKYENKTFWMNYMEHKDRLDTLRTAYHYLAKTKIETANELDALLPVLDFVQKIKEAITAIEKVTSLYPYYETFIEVYTKAIPFEPKYKKMLENLEQQLKKKPKDFKKIAFTEAFKKKYELF